MLLQLFYIHVIHNGRSMFMDISEKGKTLSQSQAKKNLMSCFKKNQTQVRNRNSSFKTEHPNADEPKGILVLYYLLRNAAEEC